jgi:hypothetical protein
MANVGLERLGKMKVIQWHNRESNINIVFHSHIFIIIITIHKLWRKPSSGTLRHVDLLRTDVSKELIASIIRVTRIGELGTTLTVTSNRSTLHCVPQKRRFLLKPHGLTSQKTPFFKFKVWYIFSEQDPTQDKEHIFSCEACKHSAKPNYLPTL